MNLYIFIFSWLSHKIGKNGDQSVITNIFICTTTVVMKTWLLSLTAAHNVCRTEKVTKRLKDRRQTQYAAAIAWSLLCINFFWVSWLTCPSEYQATLCGPGFPSMTWGWPPVLAYSPGEPPPQPHWHPSLLPVIKHQAWNFSCNSFVFIAINFLSFPWYLMELQIIKFYRA